MKVSTRSARSVIHAVTRWTLCAGLLLLAQCRMMYFPDAQVPVPERAGVPEMAAVALTTDDGLELLAWYRPPPHSAPTVVFFHGNAGHIGHRGRKVRPLLDAGFGVLLVSWRGYGGNPGSPTEQGLYHDARAALSFLADAGVPSSRVVLYGESLGSGPAVQLATERPVAAVVLEAPFTSVAEVAQRHYWFLPARHLVLDRFDSLSKITRIGAPLLIVHGEKDRVVPVEMGRALLAAAREPKDAVFVPDAGHNDLYDHGVADAVIAFVERTVGPGHE